MIKEILKKTKAKKSLIGIRVSEENWDEILIGFINSLDDVNVVINEIDEDGRSIGYTTIPINQILRIDLDDRYQTRLQFIYDNRKKLNAENQITILYNLKELLKHIGILIKNSEICTVYFDEEQYITGIILKKDSNFILVRNIGNQGDEERVSCYDLSRIVSLKYNGIEEQKIKLLHSNWKQFYKEI